jgi:hypothetical protein
MPSSNNRSLGRLAVHGRKRRTRYARDGQGDQTGTWKHDQYYAALFDSIVASTKWPMRWLLGKCRAGDRIRQEFDDVDVAATSHTSSRQDS